MPADPIGGGGPSSLVEAVGAFEEKIKRKLEAAGGGGNGDRVTWRSNKNPPKSKKESRSSSMPTESASNKNPPKFKKESRSSSMPMESADAEAAFERRLRHKLAEKNMGRRPLAASMPILGDVKAAFEGRLMRKLQSSQDDELTAQTNASIDQESYFRVSSVDFEDIFAHLQRFRMANSNNLSMSVSHPSFSHIMDALTSGGVEDLLKKRWDYQIDRMRAFKREHGHCLVPVSHPTLGDWAMIQGDHYMRYKRGARTPLTKKRFQKLKDVGFDKYVNNRERTNGNGRVDEVDDEEEAPAVVPQNLTLEDRIRWKLTQNEEQANGHVDNLQPKEQPNMVGEKQIWNKANSLEINEKEEMAADVIPETLTLDDKIEMKKMQKKKIQNQVKFVERGLKAHSSSSSSKGGRKKLNKAAVAEELYQKRMLMRSARRGLGSKLSHQVMAEVMMEGEICRDDGGDAEESPSTSNGDDGGGGTLRRYSSMMRSGSCFNLISGSWECQSCSYINEPVGLGHIMTSCKFCSEPREKEKSLRLNELSAERRTSKDDMGVDSWSELGTALQVAAEQSIRLMNVEQTQNHALDEYYARTIYGSCKCQSCSYVNEPVGLGHIMTSCKFCLEPRGKEKSLRLNELSAERRTSKDDMGVDSWSELGTALQVAAEQSICLMNVEQTHNHAVDEDYARTNFEFGREVSS